MTIKETYLDPAEKNPIKQNSVSRQLLEYASNRPAASILDFAGNGDGTTDNTNALTKAFGSGAAEIYIPQGTFLLSSTVLIPAAVRRFGGSGTILWGGAASNVPVVYTDGTDALEIYGLTFNAPRAAGGPYCIGIFDGTATTKNLYIHDIRFVHAGSRAIYGICTDANSNNFIIENIRVDDFDVGAIALTSLGDIAVRNSQLVGDGAATGHCLALQTTGKVTITGNYVYKHHGLFGIVVSDAGPGTLISNNNVIDGGVDCISINADTADVSDFAISNNIIANPTVTPLDLGIGINALPNRTISRGTVKGNYIRNRWHGAVVLAAVNGAGTVKSIEVADNFCIDPYLHDVAGNAAIVLQSDGAVGGIVGTALEPNIVRNNWIISTDGVLKYAVAETTADGTVDYTVCGDNFVKGEATGLYRLVGAHSVSGMPEVRPSATTKTTNYTLTDNDAELIFNAGATAVVTLQSAANYPGRVLHIKTVAAQAVQSSTTNVVALASTTASTAILTATAGKWARLKSDGTQWVIMASN